jgi:hypothetical protein
MLSHAKNLRQFKSEGQPLPRMVLRFTDSAMYRNERSWAIGLGGLTVKKYIEVYNQATSYSIDLDRSKN